MKTRKDLIKQMQKDQQATKQYLERDAKPKVEHTPPPLDSLIRCSPNGTITMNGIINYLESEYVDKQFKDELGAFIVRAVNLHEELLEACKNARNVLAGLVTGDLKEIRANSPALQMLRDAIAKAERSDMNASESEGK